MDQNQENNQKLKVKFSNFYHGNKIKIYCFVIILILSLISLVLIKSNNEKKNIIISEKYVQAELYLAANNKDLSKEILEEIILSNNKFYSTLALNTIIEKNLILDDEKVIKYFELLEKSASTSDQKDLIILKKALFNIKKNDVKAGENLLKKLINKNSVLKSLAQELLKK